MLAKVLSSVILGIAAHPIVVEVDCRRGLPKWTTVGLPESSVLESRDRVIAAIQNSGYDFSRQAITINLAPANIRKSGTGLDLPIAIGLLAASGLIPPEKLLSSFFVGELSLEGELKPIQGALPMGIFCQKEKQTMILPQKNLSEVAVLEHCQAVGISHLTELVEGLLSETGLTPSKKIVYEDLTVSHDIDFSEVIGQGHAKRGIEIAAAGGHNVLMIGPPGSGKTMLARRMTTILPPPSSEEMLETSQIYSVLGLLSAKQPLFKERPFRAPHHTITEQALVGGGSIPKPGEVSLAHNGILFLDELLEFHRKALDVLRQPLEDKEVTISRTSATLTFPSQFLLAATCNPCPCGFYGTEDRECLCTPHQIKKYRSKLSGPLLDRIDIHLDVPRVPFQSLIGEEMGESSEKIRDRVTLAREIQQERFQGAKTNALLTPRQIKSYCQMDSQTQILLRKACESLKLSARAYHRILKVARTIADLAGADNIERPHIAEAIQYRSLDRKII